MKASCNFSITQHSAEVICLLRWAKTGLNPRPICVRGAHVPPRESRACGGWHSSLTPHLCWTPPTSHLVALVLASHPLSCCWNEALSLINLDLSFPLCKGGNRTKCSVTINLRRHTQSARPHHKCASRTGSRARTQALRGRPQARELQRREQVGKAWGLEGGGRDEKGDSGTEQCLPFAASCFVSFKHENILQVSFYM